MKTEEIAALLVAGMQQNVTGNTDIGYHTGVVQSWDELSGVNSVLINGNTFSNLKVLSTSNSIMITAGDTVMIMRLSTQYFILGKVQAPGAGAGQRIASNRVSQLVTVPAGGGYADLANSYGPEVTMYVGTSRRVLVIHSVEVAISGSTTVDVAGSFAKGSANQGIQVSGASSMAPDTGVLGAGFQGRFGARSTVTATSLVTSAQGLQTGQNTFTCKYLATDDSGIFSQVNNRTLTVIPF